MTPLADIVTPGRHVAVVGPTASGKSAVAMALATHLGGAGAAEIVSVDSMQVYRGMDIGTAKDSAEDRATIPHHLIDIVDPDEDYTVARFAQDVRISLADIEARGRRAILVGGTGLYLRAAVEDLEIPGRFEEVRAELELEPDVEALHRRLLELDPVAAARMEPTNRRRIVRALEVTIGSGRAFSSYGPGLEAYPVSPIVLVGLRRSRDELDRLIVARYQRQLAAGFVDEVRALAARPAGLSRTARQALGYRELLGHVEAGVPVDAALDAAITRTRRFARRQERWFRRDPRIAWIDVDSGTDDGEVVSAVRALVPELAPPRP